MGRLHSFPRRSACGPLCGPFQAVAKSLPCGAENAAEGELRGTKESRTKGVGRKRPLPLTNARGADVFQAKDSGSIRIEKTIFWVNAAQNTGFSQGFQCVVGPF